MSTETRLSIRIDKNELEALKAHAESLNKTFSDWVRETLLMKAGLQDNKVEELEKRLAALEARLEKQPA